MKGGCYIAVGETLDEANARTSSEAAQRAHDSIATGFKVFGVSVGTLLAVTAGLLVWDHLDEKKHRRTR